MTAERNLDALQFNKSIASSVHSICEPLFNSFGIVHFGYIRIFPNHKMLRIANNSLWSDKYFEYNFYNDLDLYNLSKTPLNGTSSFLLVGEPQSEHCKALYNDFDMWNFLLVYERFEDYGNFWFFGARSQNTEILNIYLNHSDLLKKFIVYFKEKFFPSVDFSNPLAYITTNIDYFKKNKEAQESLHVEKFFKDTQLSKYYLDIGDRTIQFSKREAECLAYLAKGFNTKKIASLLNLSVRTIEVYLNNIKEKTCYFNKSDILQFARSASLFPTNY